MNAPSTMTRDELLNHLRIAANKANARARRNKRYDSQQRAIGAAKALATVRELVAMLPR